MLTPTSVKKGLVVLAALVATGLAHAGEVTVSAAASLTNAFKDVAQRYEAQHPGSRVLLNFGSSGAVLQQMAKGAPVDVFASADQETMDMAEAQGLVVRGERHDFARNALVLVVPSDSRQSLGRLDDLMQPAVQRVAIGNPASVPVGRYAKHALEAAKLWSDVSSKAVSTQNVRQSLDYVARGEVDAGFVYATDAAVMKDKVRVAFEVPLDVAIAYLTHLVGGRFIDPAVIDVIGRDLPPLPDYVYIVNILHGMGIHPRLDYIEHEGRLAGATNFDEFARRVAWALGELSDDERTRLRAWHGRVAPSLGAAGAPMRWAFISWEKTSR